MEINVIAGVNEINLNISDDSQKSVRQLIEEAKAVLGLSGQERVMVNGELATVSTILKGGDKVEFVKATGEKGSVDVTFGVNQMSLSLEGKTVKEVVVAVKGILGLGGDEAVKLNGTDAKADTKVEDGDEIEFVKASGEKGEARK
jgi:ribosomal 50S subunit-recycling heat shock protein